MSSFDFDSTHAALKWLNKGDFDFNYNESPNLKAIYDDSYKAYIPLLTATNLDDNSLKAKYKEIINGNSILLDKNADNMQNIGIILTKYLIDKTISTDVNLTKKKWINIMDKLTSKNEVQRELLYEFLLNLNINGKVFTEADLSSIKPINANSATSTTTTNVTVVPPSNPTPVLSTTSPSQLQKITELETKIKDLNKELNDAKIAADQQIANAKENSDKLSTLNNEYSKFIKYVTANCNNVKWKDWKKNIFVASQLIDSMHKDYSSLTVSSLIC